MTTITELTPEEREYIVERLDSTHIAELAVKICTGLEENGAVEACYQPGDGTWYALVFAKARLIGAAGGGSQNQPPTTQIGRDRFFIAYIQLGRMSSFDLHDDSEWIAGKLTDNGVSALAIATLIKTVQEICNADA